MFARRRIVAVVGLAAAALALIAPAAHAGTPQLPPGATAGDGIVCHNHKPAWRVSLANSGPDATIDYTVQADGGPVHEYQVGIGPLQLHYIAAKSGGSHLTVHADGALMIDTTQSITCKSVPTTTTTVPTTPTTVHHVAVTHTTPTTDPVVASASASPTTVAPVAHTVTPQTGKTLPFTGSSSFPLAFFGSTLVLAGAGAVYGSRRRNARS